MPANRWSPLQLVILLISVVVVSTWIDATSAGRLHYRVWLLFLGAVALVVPYGRRALLSAACYRAAFPPYSWPTIWFCYAPLLITPVAVDRSRNAGANVQPVPQTNWSWLEPFPAVLTGVFLGIAATIEFAMVTVDRHMIVGASILALIVAVPWGLVLLMSTRVIPRHTSFLPSGCRVAAQATFFVSVGTAFELIASRHGLTYPLTSFELAASSGFTGSLGALIPSVGLIALCLVTNFAFGYAIGPNRSPLVKWKRIALTSVVFGGVLAMGNGLARAALSSREETITASMLLVQPGRTLLADSDSQEACRSLCDLTERLLAKAGTGVDAPARAQMPAMRRRHPMLVVWPESVFRTTRADPTNGIELQSLGANAAGEDESSIAARIATWDAGVLFGVMDVEVVERKQYGLPVIRDELCNTAVLFQPRRPGSGGREIWNRYVKRGLVPFREVLPAWVSLLGLTEFVQEATSRELFMQPGTSPPCFTIQRGTGACPIGVSICYELFQPRLSAYSPSSNAGPDTSDHVIHLCQEQAFRGSREIHDWQRTAAVRRAVISGRWQLVANTFGQSLIVTPRGRVLTSLPSGAGGLLLRTDGTVKCLEVPLAMTAQSGIVRASNSLLPAIPNCPPPTTARQFPWLSARRFLTRPWSRGQLI